MEDIKDHTLAAYTLLTEETTTREKFESIRILIKGINPSIDKSLTKISQALSGYEKLQKGEIIELTAENLPERTEAEKERKKTLLLLIRSWKQLLDEVERVRNQLERSREENENKQQPLDTWSKILAGAKGPFGIITIAAVLIVTGIILFSQKNEEKKNTIQVIEFKGNQLPLSELEVRSGPDCDSQHYHAKNGNTIKAINGIAFSDPGGCAFGKVKEVKVFQIERSSSND